MKTLFIIPLVLMSLVSSPSWGLSMDDLVERDGLYYKKFTDVPFIVEIDDTTHVWFEVRNVDNDEYLETILDKAEDKLEIFDVLDDYDWRLSSPDSPVPANYFVDHTIEVIDLNPIDLDPSAPEML